MSNRFSALQASQIEEDIFDADLEANETAHKKEASQDENSSHAKNLQKRLAEDLSKNLSADEIDEKPQYNPRDKILQAKADLHRKLLEEFNLSALEQLPREKLIEELQSYVSDFVNSKRLALNNAEQESFVETVIDELTGLGPLEPLMRNPDISDILINGPKNCYAEISGVLQPVDIPFKDEAHLLRIINKIVAAVGRRIDESSPMCDARMADGSRFNAAIRPLTIDGPLVSIRKFSKNKLSLERLVDFNALAPQMALMLEHAVHTRMTTIISGGTGTGKTTMLNALSAFIDPRERIITIEDAAELSLQIPHVGRMETRPPNSEGSGEVSQRDLVKNALRMRPDRVILGEVRGGEAFDMLQAMNTGHEGSMATIHANAPRDAVSRLEQMLGMTGMPMTTESIRAQISSAIRLVVQLTRLSDGQRKITSISEITGMEGDIVQMQEIYRFKRTGITDEGKILGQFEATGARPRFLDELKDHGIELPGENFEPGALK